MGALAERSLRTVVVGGGPGGLFYAALAKRRFPRHEVVVYERNPPDATFGFGVVFSERTLSGLSEADPELYVDIAQASVAWEDIEVRRGGRRIRCGGHGFSAISRKTLLGLLQQRALEAGADLRFDCEAGEEELAGSDLVLAADGVNSSLRARGEAAFGPRFEVGRARYIWFATPQPFDALTFIFAHNEHGHWGVHAYPFEDGTSTFIVETDEDSWRRAGLDRAGDVPPGVSDMASLDYCERLFADHLGGHGLLENNSKWLQFRTLRCASWTDGMTALVGDAAHTAHFSVGSGTKMAMEDAVALADGVGASDGVGDALAAYQAERRPAVARIQSAAAPSLVWWERFRHLADRSDEEFMFHFLSRSPAVTRARLKARDFRFVRRVERWHARASGGAADAGPLAAPFAHRGWSVPSRLVVAPPAGVEPLAGAGGAALAGAGLVLVAAGDETATTAVGWIREHSAASLAIGVEDEEAGADAVRRALDAGFDVLAVPLAAAAARDWPSDRPVLAVVRAPLDTEGPDGDLVVRRITDLAGERLLLAGVAAPEGAGARESLVAQLLTCDRIKQEAGVPTVLLESVPDADAAATAVLAGRADLVQGALSLVSESWQPVGAAANVPAGAAPQA